jgi:hypothetical protein
MILVRIFSADIRDVEMTSWLIKSSIDENSVPALGYLKYGGTKTGEGFTFCTKNTLVQNSLNLLLYH